MARLLICFALFTASIGVLADSGEMSKSAPPPEPDCSSVIYDMWDCSAFTEVGSNKTMPTKSCCDGVKLVVDVSADCLCVGLATAKSIGIKVDDARAKILPVKCKIPATSYHDCPSSTSPPPVNPQPSPAPPTKPPSPPSPPSSPTPPSPSGGGGAAPEAPTPAPAKKSGAHSIGASCLGIFMGLALSASFVLV